MVVQAFLGVLASIVSWAISLFPSIGVPSWMSNLSSEVSGLWTNLGNLSVWAPMSLMMTVAAAVLGCWLVGLGIKLLRIVLSFLSAGGGSAG